MRHTLVALVQDRPGVLNRAVNVFRRFKLNIETLSVTRTEQQDVCRLTLVVETNDIAPVIAQLDKLIDVLEVHDVRKTGTPPRAALVRSCAPASGRAQAQADGVA
jgi:acetolactate synthase-1/3 small subunit